MTRLLLFDIDGVLIDVRPSYHQVIRRTVPTYLRDVLGLPADETLIGDEHVAAMKRMGGFNNDWNSVAAMLYTIVAHLPPVPPPPRPGIEALKESVTRALQGVDVRARLQEGARHILEMEARVRRAGGGLDSVRALVGPRNAHLVLYGPWDPKTNPVMRIYQELYLGAPLFTRVYGLEPRYNPGPGLIDAEVPIIYPRTLETLARRHPLGLVTGRPRLEAEYALKRLNLWDYFRVLVSHDDVLEEMARRGTREFLGKPHPWPLEAAARALDPEGRAAVDFVGDTVDDMRAAVALRARRPTRAIGCTYVHADPRAAAEHLRAAGADIIITHPDELEDND